MPRPHSSSCHAARPPLPVHFLGEPALTQIRDLGPEDLDALVSRWLTTLGLSAIRVRERRARMTTYQAVLGQPPLCTPIQVRVYQRENKLQVHHVDAFVGYLSRTGTPNGLLLTTGGCARDALLVAGVVQSPRLRLLSGVQWVAELAGARVGVRRRALLRWIVDIQHVVRRSPRPPREPSRRRR